MMKTPLFDKQMIAPCGMNCGTCLGFLREKNKCTGCRPDGFKPGYCSTCIIRNCETVNNNISGFCYECESYPCKRLKQLDKRYLTKYNTSFLENLQIIKEKGIDFFLVFEAGRRICHNCGEVLCVHRSSCLNCKN